MAHSGLFHLNLDWVYDEGTSLYKSCMIEDTGSAGWCWREEAENCKPNRARDEKQVVFFKLLQLRLQLNITSLKTSHL